MREFTPDYTNIIKAARNIQPERMPLYEHIISEKVMETIMNKKFSTCAVACTTIYLVKLLDLLIPLDGA